MPTGTIRGTGYATPEFPAPRFGGTSGNQTETRLSTRQMQVIRELRSLSPELRLCARPGVSRSVPSAAPVATQAQAAARLMEWH